MECNDISQVECPTAWHSEKTAKNIEQTLKVVEKEQCKKSLLFNMKSMEIDKFVSLCRRHWEKKIINFEKNTAHSYKNVFFVEAI